jgi:hypothetical protein
LVPLVVVPALIVMVLVLVFTAFGAIAGHEASPRENVERLLSGGFNERQQAAFGLVRQVVENWQARADGRDPEWEIEPDLIPELRRAWEQNREMEDPGDVPIPLALTVILARLGDEEASVRLGEMTGLGAALDPDGTYRMNAAFALGSMGERMSAGQRSTAARALLHLLDDPDVGMRLSGVCALQSLPAPETIPALQRMLSESSLQVRGCAALSLARLGDESGVPVLREMLSAEAYREERERDSRLWAKERFISDSRKKALSALVELGHPPDRAALERMAEGDEDASVRELARDLLAESDAPARE